MNSQSNKQTENPHEFLFGMGYILGSLATKNMMVSDMFGNIVKNTISTLQIMPNEANNIGKITDKGFDLDLNNMEVNKKYLIFYEGSKYEIMRNRNDELELFEIG